jgi:hypothetical protein
VLKRLVNQSRPLPELDATTTFKIRPSDGGMPSSHAMSLGFLGTFTGLSLPWTRLPIAAFSFMSLTYRVQAKLHTVEQILVGGLIGSLNGAVWQTALCPCVQEWMRTHLLNEQALLPWSILGVAALVGLATVSSLERQVSAYIKTKKK